MALPARSKWTIAFCLVAIGVAGFLILRFAIQRSPGNNNTLDRCVGARLAEEAIRLADGTGTIVAFTAAETEFKSETDNAQLRGFRERLQRSTGITLVVVPPANSEAFSRITSLSGLSEDVVTGLHQQYPAAKVIVSFLGGPQFHPLTPTTPSPKFIALEMSPAPDWNALFAHPELTAIIWGRQGEHALTVRPADGCQKLFDAWFTVVTRDNYRQYQP